MSTANELLNSLSFIGGEEEHVLVGGDRVVSVPPSLRKIAVEHDHNVATVVFDCPRYWDEGRVDLANMKVYVNFVRADGVFGSYLTEVEIDEENPSIVHFSWLLSRHATGAKGGISFLVCAKQVNEDGDELRHWNSELNSDMSVSAGMEVDEVVVAKYPDILTHILARLDYVEVNGGGSGNVPAAQKPIISEVTLTSSGWVGSESPYSQVVNIEGVTANSQVDLTPSVEPLAIFYQKDLGFVTENDNGVVTVYAIGDKPTNDYTIQVTITEVTV